MVRKKFIILFILGLSIVLSSCVTANPVYEPALYEENDEISEEAAQNTYLPTEQEEETLTFYTTKRIHENLPEFTFIHEITGIATVHYVTSAHVRITIKDNEGNLIQEIDDMIQSWQEPFRNERFGIRFTDFNFDGYLDMWLMLGENPGTTLGWAWIYYWLWNPEVGQFVQNEQLSMMTFDRGNMVWLDVYCEETELLVATSTGGASMRFRDYYEYDGEQFIRVAEVVVSFPIGYDGVQYQQTTHTNLVTGEVTVETIPFVPPESASTYRSPELEHVIELEWKVIVYEHEQEEDIIRRFRLYLIVNGETEYYVISGYSSWSTFGVDSDRLVLDAPPYALSTLSSLWTGFSLQLYIYKRSDTELAVMFRAVDFMSPDRREYKEVLVVPIEEGTQILVSESLIREEPEPGYM